MLNWGRHNAQRLPVRKEAGPMLSAGCAHVGPSRPLGPMLGQVVPMLSYVGPFLGPCWAYVGPMLAYVGPMLAMFLTSPRWNSLPSKGPKHRKKTMFFNTASKIHRQLQGWTRGASGSPYKLRLPLQASTKDTGPRPAPGFKGCRPAANPVEKNHSFTIHDFFWRCF